MNFQLNARPIDMMVGFLHKSFQECCAVVRIRCKQF